MILPFIFFFFFKQLFHHFVSLFTLLHSKPNYTYYLHVQAQALNSFGSTFRTRVHTSVLSPATHFLFHPTFPTIWSCWKASEPFNTPPDLLLTQYRELPGATSAFLLSCYTSTVTAFKPVLCVSYVSLK